MKKYLFFITLFVYLFFAGKFQYQFSVTKTNYFILLSDAFLNGQSHLRLIPQYLRDLSLYNGKYYLYWPPLPAVLYLPIVALFGTNISDIFLLSITASVVPLLLFLSLEELKKSKIVILERKQILLLSLFLAFGTCFFSISILGTVWFTSQVVTLLVFALALLFAIRFFNYDNKIDFILGSIFFALLVWTRFTVLFSSPLFLYIYSYKRKKMVLPFLSFLFFSVLILGLYNQTRFGSFF
ncbi:MAG: hypothetical protein M1365_01085, partial [Actinobacteria bacterium]|nr:hypothetical protein [Actinomycetota bacterium]